MTQAAWPLPKLNAWWLDLIYTCGPRKYPSLLQEEVMIVRTSLTSEEKLVLGMVATSSASLSVLCFGSQSRIG